jgi:hypothetical protein
MATAVDLSRARLVDRGLTSGHSRGSPSGLSRKKRHQSIEVEHPPNANANVRPRSRINALDFERVAPSIAKTLNSAGPRAKPSHQGPAAEPQPEAAGNGDGPMTKVDGPGTALLA